MSSHRRRKAQWGRSPGTHKAVALAILKGARHVVCLNGSPTLGASVLRQSRVDAPSFPKVQQWARRDAAAEVVQVSDRLPSLKGADERSIPWLKARSI